MGYWVDMEHPYVTYENSYIETLWWLLRQLYDKGLLYKGYTIQPYSPAAGTGLSSHELNQPGCYRDVKDTTVTAQFGVTDATAHLFENPEALPVYFLAWTTTPWTAAEILCVPAPEHGLFRPAAPVFDEAFTLPWIAVYHLHGVSGYPAYLSPSV